MIHEINLADIGIRYFLIKNRCLGGYATRFVGDHYNCYVITPLDHPLCGCSVDEIRKLTSFGRHEINVSTYHDSIHEEVREQIYNNVGNERIICNSWIFGIENQLYYIQYEGNYETVIYYAKDLAIKLASYKGYSANKL